jgi:phosphoglucosamine mutase
MDINLPDDVERAIEVKIEGDLSKELALPADLGKATRLDDALGRYVEHVKGSFPKGLNLEGYESRCRLCAHGAAYKVAPQVLWELEAEVVSIGVAPNGRNINDGCGATATDASAEGRLSSIRRISGLRWMATPTA